MRNILFLLLILFGINSPVFSQLVNPGIERLSKDADIILTGKVVHQKSNWNKDHSRIYTDVTVEINECLKGNANNAIVIKNPGGEVGEVGELYSHMPTFKNDEEVLLFVKKDREKDAFKVLDGAEGKVTLIKDLKTGEMMTSSKEKISSLKKDIKTYLIDK